MLGEATSKRKYICCSPWKEDGIGSVNCHRINNNNATTTQTKNKTGRIHVKGNMEMNCGRTTNWRTRHENRTDFDAT